MYASHCTAGSKFSKSPVGMPIQASPPLDWRCIKKLKLQSNIRGKLRQHSEYDCSVYEIGRLERWATLVLFAALASQVRVVLALALPF